MKRPISPFWMITQGLASTVTPEREPAHQMTDIPAPPRPAPVTAELRPSGSLTLLWEPHRPIRTCLGREGTDYARDRAGSSAQLCCSPEQPVLVHTIQSAAGVPNKHQQTTVPMPKNNKRGLGRPSRGPGASRGLVACG